MAPFSLPWSEPEKTSRIPSLPSMPDLPALPELPTSLKNIKLPKININLPKFPVKLTKTQQRVVVGVVSCVALGIVISAIPRRSPRRIISSPRDAVDELTSEERAELAYPPNALPGGRDVETPYGTIHVFEWGPDTGDRIMLVPGISTPCLALGDLGWEFARMGFRVILFDLYSRGYSSGPDPASTPYDSRLFTSQMLAVHASCMATLPQGASPKFHLVGYSLGGTLAVSFTRYYPHLVTSLTLVAPSGLLRRTHLGLLGRLLYSPTSPLPNFLAAPLVRWRINPSLAYPQPSDPDAEIEEPLVPNPATSEEAVAKRNGSSFDLAPIFMGRPNISIGAVVQWQIRSHVGFVPAFISTMTHAPIYAPQPDWATLAELLALQRAGRHRSRRHGKSSRHSSGKDRDERKDREKEKEREQRRKEKDRRKEKERKEREKEKDKEARRSSKSSSSKHRTPSAGGSGSAVGVGSSSSSSRSHHRSSRDNDRTTIHGGKVLMILGSQDPVIPMDETVKDALDTLGQEGVQLAVVDGGHDIPITHADEVARFVMSFLGNESLRITKEGGKGGWDTQSEASSVFSSIRSGH